MLCGVWEEGPEWNRKQKGTYTAEGIAPLADALRVSPSLTHLDARYNYLGEGEAVLQEAVKDKLGFKLEL